MAVWRMQPITNSRPTRAGLQPELLRCCALLLLLSGSLQGLADNVESALLLPTRPCERLQAGSRPAQPESTANNIVDAIVFHERLHLPTAPKKRHPSVFVLRLLC